MHQCDVCPWYCAPRDCECPYVMREKACEDAKEKIRKINQNTANPIKK